MPSPTFSLSSNESTLEYYAGLNRKVSKSYSDRCGTFVAIADETLVPEIDWNYALDRKYRGDLGDLNFGIEFDQGWWTRMGR